MPLCGFRMLSLQLHLTNQTGRLGRDVRNRAVTGKYFAVIF